MAETAKWYVVHTYSGYENTVMATIEKTVETRQLQDIIQQVSIPMETVTEVTEKGPKTYDRKVFPGYVLVKMIMTDDSWYVVRNIRGVRNRMIGPDGNTLVPFGYMFFHCLFGARMCGRTPSGSRRTERNASVP